MGCLWLLGAAVGWKDMVPANPFGSGKLPVTLVSNRLNPAQPTPGYNAGHSFSDEILAKRGSDPDAGLDEGKLLYERHCAECHGSRGEGTDEYAAALQGDWSIEQLVAYIDPSMPPEEPELCVGPEAELVARYIYAEFYSPQSRLRAVRQADFSRLTVRQLRETVADLSLSFTAIPDWGSERGLRGVYYAARNRTEQRKLAEQTDANLNFANGVPHFDATSAYPQLPKPEKPPENKMNDGFSAYWSGSLIAPTTGRYKIVVRSQNGFQLRLNSREPLIDRKVRSDTTWDHEAEIFLLAGRAYPLTIDFFSYPDPPAKFELSWQPPQGLTEIIPQSFLIPKVVPESLALSTSFPPDDSSQGYERGTSVSREWDEALTAAAWETADWMSERIDRLAGIKPNDEKSMEKIQAWSEMLFRVLLGRELTAAEKQFYIEQHFAANRSMRESTQDMIFLWIKSPRFLYPSIESETPSMQVARQLALTLWDSFPDQTLLQLAGSGQLTQPQVIDGEISRMLRDPRAKSKLRAFFEDWLQLERGQVAAKDRDRFPEFNERLAVDLRRSLMLFLDHVAWSDTTDYRTLFQSNELPVNLRLARYYQVTGNLSDEELLAWGLSETDDRYISIALDEQYWCGILTHPFLTAKLAYHRHSSPIHRGVFVTRQLLGRSLRQPNENFEPLTEAFDPRMSNRQRVEYQTQDAACMGCHQLINPLGFCLENFDATGRFQTQDGPQAIDTRAKYLAAGGEEIPLAGPRDLANLVANDPMAQRHFVRQLFARYAKQPIEVWGPQRLEELHREWLAEGLKLPQLLTRIAQVTVSPPVPPSK